MKFGLVRESLGHIILNNWLYFNLFKPNYTVVLFYNRKTCHNEPALFTIVNELKKRYKIILINNWLMCSIVYRLAHSNVFSERFKEKLIANTYSIHHSNEFIAYGSNYRMWYENFPVPNSDAINQHEESFKKWAQKHKLKEPYVCVFSRDSLYHGYQEVDTFRNSEFKDILPSIKYLIEKGYQVVRVGRGRSIIDNTGLSLSSYIDFDKTNTDDKSIDLMLIKNCEFLLASNSGIICVGLMFNKKILIHNWFPAGIRPQFERGTYIQKKYSKNGEIISYGEISKNLLLEENSVILANNGIGVINNSPDEILEMVTTQVESNFSSTVNIHPPFEVYGGNSNLSKTWYDKNQNLFS